MLLGWLGYKVILGWSFHLTEDSVYCFFYIYWHINAASYEWITQSRNGFIHWLTTHQYNTSAHPDSAFDSGSFRNAAVVFLYKIWEFPDWRPSNMSVNHVSVVEGLSCWLWCDSHRTCMWTTPILVDKQMIQWTVHLFFRRSLLL